MPGRSHAQDPGLVPRNTEYERPGFFGGCMDESKMFVITATTGEYADKSEYVLFVCKSHESAETCLRAVDNWFALQGAHRRSTTGYSYDVSPYRGMDCRYEVAAAFKDQFGVFITIDYTGIEFDARPIPVYTP